MHQIVHSKHIMKFGAFSGSSVENMNIEDPNYDSWTREDCDTFQKVTEVVDERFSDFRSLSVDNDDNDVETSG
jgi:hypothetical protein